MKTKLIILGLLISCAGFGQVFSLDQPDSVKYITYPQVYDLDKLYFQASVNAGANDTITAGQTYQLAGTKAYMDSVVWTTSGTGTFSDDNSLTAVYTPSGADVAVGSVNLTLTGTLNGVTTSDVMILTLPYNLTASALFARMSEQPNTQTKAAISRWYDTIQVYHIDDSLDFSYNYAVQTEQAALLDWINPNRTGTAVNSPEFTAWNGFTTDADSYLKTNYNPATDAVNWLQNSASIGVYILSNNQAGNPMGISSGNISYISLDGTYFYIGINNTSITTYYGDGNDITGLTIHQRINDTQLQRSRKGVNFTTYTKSSTGLSSQANGIFVGASNTNGNPASYSANQYAFAHGGGALTETQKTKLYKADSTYLEDVAELKLTATLTTGGEQSIVLKGIEDATPIIVAWGDGQYDVLTMDGVADTISNTYAAAGTYKIKLYNVAGLDSFALDSSGNMIRADISTFNTAVNLKGFSINHGGSGVGMWTGSMSGLTKSIRSLVLVGYNLITGDITGFNSLENIELRSGCAITGDITGATNLRICLLLGANTITGDITEMVNLTNVYLNHENDAHCEVIGDVTNLVNLVQLEGQTDITGSITGLTQLGMICVGGAGNNTLSGDVTNLTSLYYLSCTGQNTLTGSISGLTSLWYLGVGGSNTLTGSLADLDLMEICLAPAGITKPTTVANMTRLSYFVSPSTWTYTEGEVNQILADFVANKDIARVNAPVTYRTIDIRGNALSAAPSGQGITDKSTLQAYRSPDNDAQYSLWTVLTR